MTLVGSRVNLTHMATVQRDANLDQMDSAGFPAAPAWQDHLTALPCRLWTETGRETVLDKTTVVVVEQLRLVVTTDSDVVETDRLGDVTYRGDTLLAGPVSIRAVLRYTDHLELVLVRAS